MNRVLNVVNPGGHGGAGMRTWETFLQAWGDPIATEQYRTTEGPGDSRKIAGSAQGFDVLVAVGGDGTVGGRYIGEE